MNLLRRLPCALHLRPRQVFEVPTLPAPVPLTGEEWTQQQQYETATYPAYRLAQLAELADHEETARA